MKYIYLLLKQSMTWKSGKKILNEICCASKSDTPDTTPTPSLFACGAPPLDSIERLRI